MRVALAHDWLTGMRGGERVLEALVHLHPAATIHTLIHIRGSTGVRRGGAGSYPHANGARRRRRAEGNQGGARASAGAG
jgi:hypothetical protein